MRKMSSSNTNTSSLRQSLVLTILLLVFAAPALTKVTSYTDTLDPFTFTGTGNNYQYRLDAAFDFTEAKYPITIDADGLGDKAGYTYQTVAQTIKTDTSFETLNSMFMIDHNNLIVTGSKPNPEHIFIEVIQCGSPESIDKFGCETNYIQLPKTIVSGDFVVEASRFDQRSGLYIVALRNPKTNKVVLFAKVRNSDQVDLGDDVADHVEIDLMDNDVLTIANRVRIELLPNEREEPDPETGGTKTIKFTQIYLFDQYIDNGKDAKHSQYLLTASLDGTFKEKKYMLKEGGKYKLDNTNNLVNVDTITTFYEHEGALFLGAELNSPDQKGFKCMTRINEPTETTFTLAPPGYGFVCADIKGGDFFGMSYGNELFQLVVDEDSQELRVFTISDAQEPKVNLQYKHAIKINTAL